ncbi:MAG: aldehyde dehydrogenase family protein [Planctomycetota bacterium]|nr:MAG: aldehyde dehydrogenase family protein [Planctomycetota bacterium]
MLLYFYDECIREIREQIPKTHLEADKDFWEGKRAADHLEGAAIPALQGETFPLLVKNHTYWNSYVPGGVTALITPMNFIYGIPLIQLIGCYLSGSPFVYKGHPFAGITNSTLIRMLLAAGANPRAIAKIEGFGKKVSSLAGDSRVSIVSVTGSSFTAEAIRQMRGLRTLHFEGGGCNWCFVDDTYSDEELKKIAIRLVYAKLGLSSHKCTTLHGIAGKKEVLDKLLPYLVEEMKSWKICDPRKTEESKVIGPAMVHKAITTTRIMEAAKKAGCTIHLEGGKVTGDEYSDHAEVVAPVIIGGVTPETTITVDWDDKGERTFHLATTELFAPVLNLMEMKSFEDFLSFALFTNPHDLAISIYTRDEQKLQKARLSLGGMLKIQDGTDSALEWESFGASGVGDSGNMGVGNAISTIRLFCRKQKGRHVVL